MNTLLSTTPNGLEPPAIRGCYLVCFDRPFHGANGRHIGAHHYVGYSDNIAERLDQHRQGRGSPLLAAALAAGIDWQLVQVWPDADRRFERKLHHRHGSRLCPRAACRSIQRERRCQLRLPIGSRRTAAYRCSWPVARTDTMNSVFAAVYVAPDV
jgi:hypothetical protein